MDQSQYQDFSQAQENQETKKNKKQFNEQNNFNLVMRNIPVVLIRKLQEQGERDQSIQLERHYRCIEQIRKKNFQNLDVFLLTGNFLGHKLCLEIIQNRMLKDKNPEIFDEIFQLYQKDLKKLSEGTGKIRDSLLRFLKENSDEYHDNLKKQTRKDYEKNKQTLEIMRKSLIIYLEEQSAKGIIQEKIKIFNRIRVLEKESEQIHFKQNNGDEEQDKIMKRKFEEQNLSNDGINIEGRKMIKNNGLSQTDYTFDGILQSEPTFENNDEIDNYDFISSYLNSEKKSQNGYCNNCQLKDNLIENLKLQLENQFLELLELRSQVQLLNNQQQLQIQKGVQKKLQANQEKSIRNQDQECFLEEMKQNCQNCQNCLRSQNENIFESMFLIDSNRSEILSTREEKEYFYEGGELENQNLNIFVLKELRYDRKDLNQEASLSEGLIHYLRILFLQGEGKSSSQEEFIELSEQVKMAASSIYFQSENEKEEKNGSQSQFLNNSVLHLNKLQDQFKIYEQDFEKAIQLLEDMIGVIAKQQGVKNEIYQRYQHCEKLRKLGSLKLKLNKKKEAAALFLQSTTLLTEIWSEDQKNKHFLNAVALYSYESSLLVTEYEQKLVLTNILNQILNLGVDTFETSQKNNSSKTYFYLFFMISKSFLQLQENEKALEILVFISKNLFKQLKPKYRINVMENILLAQKKPALIYTNIKTSLQILKKSEEYSNGSFVHLAFILKIIKIYQKFQHLEELESVQKIENIILKETRSIQQVERSIFAQYTYSLICKELSCFQTQIEYLIQATQRTGCTPVQKALILQEIGQSYLKIKNYQLAQEKGFQPALEQWITLNLNDETDSAEIKNNFYQLKIAQTQFSLSFISLQKGDIEQAIEFSTLTQKIIIETLGEFEAQSLKLLNYWDSQILHLLLFKQSDLQVIKNFFVQDEFVVSESISSKISTIYNQFFFNQIKISIEDHNQKSLIYFSKN